MNKYVHSLALMSSLLLTTSTYTVDYFSKMAPSITKNAVALNNVISEETALVFLNLFAFLHTPEETPALIKCIEFIESTPEFAEPSQQFSKDVIEKLQQYATNIQEKIARKGDISEVEQDRLWNKLEAKVQELMAYIHGIYYQVFYNDITEKNPAALKYMFDENGLIPAEQRTKDLPKPW